MSLKLSVIFLFLQVLIFSNNLEKNFLFFLNRTIEYKKITTDIINTKYERRSIRSQSFPHLKFNFHLADYSGVFDLNNIKAQYLNFVFDIDVNFARNLNTDITILQNIYSGEKISDMLYLNSTKKKMLTTQKKLLIFNQLKKFFKIYLELLQKKYLIAQLKNQIEIDKITLKKQQNKMSKNSIPIEIYKKKITQEQYYLNLEIAQFNNKWSNFKEKTKLSKLRELMIKSVPKLRFNTNNVKISLIKNSIISSKIQANLNSDDFKPNINIFYKYGAKDQDMERLNDGYSFGIIMEWNIFDGFNAKNKNKVIYNNIKIQKEKLNNTLKLQQKDFEFLTNNIQEIQSIINNEQAIIKLYMNQYKQRKIDYADKKITYEALLKSKSELLDEQLNLINIYKKFINSFIYMLILADNYDVFWQVISN